VVLGKPIIHLLFQHGAFTPRSSSLVYIALIGYACILPGRVADELLNRSFYALKDARTPLFIDIVALGARIGLVLILIRLLHDKYLILSIPLAVGGAAALEAVLLGFLLLARLRSKVKMDQGMQRLQREREAAESKETEPELETSEAEQLEATVVLEPISSPEKQTELEPDLSNTERGQPEAKLEPEFAEGEQEATKSVSKPAPSGKKRTANRQGAGKRNGRKRSNRG
jgi:hypothetical protein